jgi:hypothetical protein
MMGIIDLQIIESPESNQDKIKIFLHYLERGDELYSKYLVWFEYCQDNTGNGIAEVVRTHYRLVQG